MRNEDGVKYFEIVIVARSPKTDIWLAHEGHLVQKGDGVLATNILTGDYTVEFGLGSPTYPLLVARDVRWTEEEITASPPCPDPFPMSRLWTPIHEHTYVSPKPMHATCEDARA